MNERDIVVSVVITFHHKPWGLPRHRQPSQYDFSIEIGLERAPFVVFVYFFSSFEHAKNLLIMGPNSTKNSSKCVIFSYLTMNTIVRILILL